MQAGKPISTCAEDAFERLTFAQHLAGCLCLPEGAPSIVVGVEGEWGLGKTSCINLVPADHRGVLALANINARQRD